MVETRLALITAHLLGDFVFQSRYLESKDRKLAEYIIIGTFLSFGWALAWSVPAQNAIEYWRPRQPAAYVPLRVLLEQSAPAQR